MNERIEIYDTTLRDGAQSEGISFSVNDKIKIIKLLDALSVGFIEAGWPGANPKDIEVFEIAKDIQLKHSTITAFGCTRKAEVKACDDKVLNMLLEANTSVITIFGKTWDFHVKHALNTTLKENLSMISDSIEYLISKGKRVFFDAEHFFDGYKNNPEYAIKAIKAAHNAGAERIILCDTNGGCINTEIYKITKTVKKELPDAMIGIHSHNDGDMAVANALAAVEAGTTQIQGTFNGYGERCGNANLCSIIPNLQLKMGRDILGEKLGNLVYVSNQISEIANKMLSENAPFVGRSAFAHKAGIHASGVRKNSTTYEHISPDSVGNTRRFLVSDQAGAASVRAKLVNLRLNTVVKDSDIPKIIDHTKKFEWKGYCFEDADASFELMIQEVLKERKHYFELMGFRVIGDTFGGAKDTNTEASVKIRIGEEIYHTVSEGHGPVNSLDRALRKALIPVYPEIQRFKLSDFKVRILDSTDGTGATVRVHIETTDGINRWDTVGVNENVIEASYAAIVDSISFGLSLYNVQPPNT